MEGEGVGGVLLDVAALEQQRAVLVVDPRRLLVVVKRALRVFVVAAGEVDQRLRRAAFIKGRDHAVQRAGVRGEAVARLAGAVEQGRRRHVHGADRAVDRHHPAVPLAVQDVIKLRAVHVLPCVGLVGGGQHGTKAALEPVGGVGQGPHQDRPPALLQQRLRRRHPLQRQPQRLERKPRVGLKQDRQHHAQVVAERPLGGEVGEGKEAHRGG